MRDRAVLERSVGAPEAPSGMAYSGNCTPGDQAMKNDLPKKPPIPFSRSRRELLGLIGTSAAASLLGDLGGRSAAAGPAAAPACVVRPEQTEGPYFVDDRLRRSDIRVDPSDGSVKPGMPLRLSFRVSRIDGRACAPLGGAIVDVWQCDALGVYSGVRDFNGLFDTRGKQFLRGYQVTDADGTARFLTIYPGWYPGRTVHIHFKVRTDPAARKGHEFTSQLYFDDAVSDRVHAQAPYAGEERRRMRNAADGIFRNGGEQLMLRLEKDAQGYAGTFDIGLRMPGSLA
jgi:protocatechuate 3,4-dioxygenase beta subunit